MATSAKETLASALVAAQAELHAPPKNRTVKVKSDRGSYSFDYATLDSIVEGLLRPVLPKHGLWFVQSVRDGHMVTMIVHESGETLECGVPMPNLPAKPQEAGSLISYFKRYSLCAAFGLVAEEDDDANVAQGNGFEAKPRMNGKIDDQQWAHIVSLVQASKSDTGRFCKYLGVPSLKDIPRAKYEEAVAALEAKIKPAEAVQ